jgi:hypothetical protein
MYPCVVRYLVDGLVKVDLLSIPVVKESSCTGENIFNSIDNDLKSRNLSWEKCMAFGSDNASVMSGKNKGVIAYVKRKQDSVHFAGCACHLLHLVAKYANDECIPAPIADTLTDMFYYLKNSAKRLTELKDIQSLFGKDHLKVLKYVPTRWLSLLTCVERILELWESLKKYFSGELKGAKGNTERLERVCKFLKSHSAKTYCLFLKYILPSFVRANLSLQTVDPMIQASHQILMDLYRSILTKFIKPAAFACASTPTEIDLSRACNLKTNQEMLIGEEVSHFMESKKMDSTKVKGIIDNIRKFYTKAADYMKKNILNNCELIVHAQIADATKVHSAKVSSLKYFLKRFPFILPEGCSVDTVLSEFSELQSEQLNHHDDVRADQRWKTIGEMRDASGNPKYANISYIMKCVLLIPHSNACCERVFSLVRKTRTVFRSTMNVESVESICINKMHGQVCHQRKYTDDFLKNAKYATVDFVKPKSH